MENSVQLSGATSSYTLNPNYDIVNTWRFHTFPFTGCYLGNTIPSYWRPIPENIKEKHHNLTRDLPKEMIVQPPRLLGEIGWEIDGALVNMKSSFTRITSIACIFPG